MDSGDQIQQTNLVSDDVAAALDNANMNPAAPATANATTVEPQADPLPAGSAADPAPPVADTAFNQPAVTQPQTPPSPNMPSETPASDSIAAGSDELDEIKRKALENLKPLIEHVEQSPEERYETVMMMIRSNDDPKLIPTAYESAQSIEDEKKRANALLNIVSEIEYLKSKAQN